MRGILDAKKSEKMKNIASNGLGVKDVQYVSIGAGSASRITGEVVQEALVCISVNGQEVATFMCSPTDLNYLAVGFLYNEQIIESFAEVRSVHVSKSDTCVDVWLHDPSFEPPKRGIITAGCGGGITFDDLSKNYSPLSANIEAHPDRLAELMRQMHLGAELYQRARGIHTAALAKDDQILIQVEDVGRHNCLDKLVGLALFEGITTRDHILLSSGRISSEMINKARRMKTPIVCSRTSPTGLSVALAETWNITLVAYLRQKRMRVYSHPERISGLQEL